MTKTSKKGFTLVELVIVIAVIAILAAVLIPTFSSVVKKAQYTSDIQLVKNLNLALEADDGKTHATMTEALDAAKEYGYDVAKINSKGTDSEILWDSVNDVFCYLQEDGSIEYIPDSVDKGLEKGDYRLWKISNSVDPTYSTYLYNYSGTTVTTSKGVDVGECDVTAVNYINTGDSQNVVIRTNGQECVLTIYGPNDHVEHYGYATKTNVVSVNDTASYHEFGTSKNLAVTSGKVVVENTGIVFDIKREAYTAVEGVNIPTTAVVTTNSITNNGGNVLKSSVSEIADTTTFNINSLAQFESFRDATNSGLNFKGITVELNCDIKLTEAWRPISDHGRNEAKANTYTATAEKTVAQQVKEHTDTWFAGTFDGNNHTISGLTNKDYPMDMLNVGHNSTTPEGSNEFCYGLFASTCDATIKDLVLTNVNIVTYNASTKVCSEGVGALVGYLYGNSTISNVKVSGSVVANNVVGALVGFVREGTVSFTDCSSDATVVSDNRAAGLIGNVADESDVNTFVTIKNCSFTGNVKTNASSGSKGGNNTIAGLVMINTSDKIKVTIENCSVTNNPTANSEYVLIGKLWADQDAGSHLATKTFDANVTTAQTWQSDLYGTN